MAVLVAIVILSAATVTSAQMGIEGSTIFGREIMGGQAGFPYQGGAGAGENHRNGLRGGWDGNPASRPGAGHHGSGHHGAGHIGGGHIGGGHIGGGQIGAGHIGGGHIGGGQIGAGHIGGGHIGGHIGGGHIGSELGHGGVGWADPSGLGGGGFHGGMGGMRSSMGVGHGLGAGMSVIAGTGLDLSGQDMMPFDQGFGDIGHHDAHGGMPGGHVPEFLDPVTGQGVHVGGGVGLDLPPVGQSIYGGKSLKPKHGKIPPKKGHISMKKPVKPKYPNRKPILPMEPLQPNFALPKMPMHKPIRKPKFPPKKPIIGKGKHMPSIKPKKPILPPKPIKMPKKPMLSHKPIMKPKLPLKPHRPRFPIMETIHRTIMHMLGGHKGGSIPHFAHDRFGKKGLHMPKKTIVSKTKKTMKRPMFGGY